MRPDLHVKKPRPTWVGTRLRCVCGGASAVVAAPAHRGEGHDLLLAAALLAGLLVVTLGARALYDVLAVELLLHATKRTVDGLVLADLDFDGHGLRAVLVGKAG